MTAAAPPPPPTSAQPAGPAAGTVHLHLLGTPTCRVAGRKALTLSPKDAALLAVLALDGPKSRDALCALLWPDADAHQAAASLRQRLSRLRRALGAELVHSADVLRLASGVQVDALQLQQLDAPALMACAELLAGMEFGALDELDPWLAAARTRLAEQRAHALAAHAEKLMQGGALHAALPLAGRIVELTPLAEHAWRRVMRLHYLRGDRGAALAAFERLNHLLMDELGVQPSTETLQLWQTIESAVPAAQQKEHRPQQPVPASVMLPPVMVGRGGAWHAMAQAWQAGRPFVLVGEAGLGKSRLLHEFLHGRSSVVAGKARPGDAQLPYAVLGRVLLAVQQRFDVQLPETTRRDINHITPELGPMWPAAARPETLRHAIEEFLAAATAAGLKAVALDDMHDADLATLEALRWASQSPRLAELKLALALRPPRAAATAQLLQDWLTDSQPPVQVPLAPLSQADLATLLASLALPDLVDPAVTAHLYRHAGGHPLYTLATLQDALAHNRDLRQPKWPDPPSVQALLDTRLRELPPATAALLQVAAVGGADLNAERAAALLGCPTLQLAPTWQALEAANVLRGEAFTHDLVHEAALRAVPLALRRALHRQWAERLSAELSSVEPSSAQHPAAPANVARMAWHWENGERWAQAGHCWQRAAHAARQSGRLAEQCALFEHAARCHARAGDDAARFDALASRLDGLQLQQGGAAVLAVLPELDALALSGAQRLRCQLARAEALLDAERAAEALVQAQAAVQAAVHHPQWAADAAGLLAMALAQTQQFEAALAAAQAAVASAVPAGPTTPATAQQLRSTHALAYVLYSSGRLADAVPVQRSSLVLAERLGDHAEAAAIEGHLAALLASVGDVPATHQHAVHAARRRQAAGLAEDGTLGTVNLIIRGNAAAYLGEFTEALDAQQTAAALARHSDNLTLQVKARLALANLCVTLGDAQAARQAVAELPAGTLPAMQMQAALLLARAAALDGAPQRRHWQALSRLAAAHPQLPLVQSAWYEVSFQGDAASVIHTLSRVRAECVELGLHGTARALHLRELVRGLDVHGAAATEQVQQAALALLPHAERGMSAKVYPPQALLALATAFARAGDLPQSAACLQQGQRWVQRALATVPAVHRQGFAAVNSVNRTLLQD